jgi:hypothetical protein
MHLSRLAANPVESSAVVPSSECVVTKLQQSAAQISDIPAKLSLPLIANLQQNTAQ